MFTTTQSNCYFEGLLTEGGDIPKKNRIQIDAFENGLKWTVLTTSAFRRKTKNNVPNLVIIFSLIKINFLRNNGLFKKNLGQSNGNRITQLGRLFFVLRLKSIQHILIICSFNLLFFNSLMAQLDTSHIYVDTMSRANLDPIQNTSLTLRPLSELTELAILNAPELKNNQVEYARQAMVVKLQKRAWLDNISINTASLYGNGTIVDASNNGTTTAYALSDRKSLNFNVGVGVRISGGDILNRGTKVEIQRIQLEKVQNDRLIVESRIRETVINIYTQLELALKIVKLRGDVVENQRLALTIADKYFQEGKYKPTDYGTLLDKITAAQEQYEQAKSEAKKLALLLKNIVNVSVWK